MRSRQFVPWVEVAFPLIPNRPHVLLPFPHVYLQAWKASGKRGIWLKVSKPRSSLIPHAVEQGFDFHHAERGHVMLTLWLEEGPCTLPSNASHQVIELERGGV